MDRRKSLQTLILGGAAAGTGLVFNSCKTEKGETVDEVIAESTEKYFGRTPKELERIALEDPYFKDKKLFPNVDFYSGIILDAMGFPTSMFTPIFALARTVGWIAQWKEMIGDEAQKIGRPRQLYVGPPHRNYVDCANR